jgi:hypothetical protein
METWWGRQWSGRGRLAVLSLCPAAMASCATFNTIDSEVVVRRHFSATCTEVRNLVVSIVESSGLRLVSETRAHGSRYILAASADSTLDELRFRTEFVVRQCDQHAHSIIQESALEVGVEVWDGAAGRWTRCVECGQDPRFGDVLKLIDIVASMKFPTPFLGQSP